MNALIDAANDYLDRGLRVIALEGKMPNRRIHPHGLHDFIGPDTTFSGYGKDAALEHVFTHEDTTGIGILTGPVYYVVDIDGEEGAAAWRELAGDAYMPNRWVARTGRGLHLWYADYREWPTVKLAEKLDFKGVGGYVAAPPSRHPDGHMYEWLLPPTDGEPPMEFPDPLYRLLDERRALREAAMVTKAMSRPVPLDQRIPGLIYRDASFEGVLAKVREAGEGNRNNVLYWAAATMRDEGGTDDDFAELLDAAVSGGLPRFEARRTIRSAMSEAR